MKLNEIASLHKQGAGCLFLATEDDKFLLIKRSNYDTFPNTWALPGGMVETGETPIEACIRECMEEIGRDIGESSLHLIHKTDYHAPRFSFYTFATVVSKEFSPRLNYESSEYIWCTIDDLPSPLHPGVAALFANDSAAKKLAQLKQQ